MFNKNRKGSTLALTLIIFAVLMIFATFILSFMVTENKQAMYHQNKTQAYYIARSGAEIVEEAIKGSVKKYTAKEVTDFLNAIPTNDPDNPLDKSSYMEVSISTLNYGGYKQPKAYVYKEIKTDEMYSIIVVSESDVGGVVEVLEKEILAPKKIESGIVADAPINYIESIDPIEETWKNAGHKVSQATLDKYPLFDFDEDINTFQKLTSLELNPYVEISNNVNLLTGNYKIESFLDWKDKEVYVNGKVNVYIKDYVNIHNLIIKGTNDPELNIFIYGEELFDTKSLFTENKALNNIDGNVEVNFYVKSGNVSLNLFQNKNEVLDANIVATKEVENIEFTAKSNSGKPNIIGLIYAPGSNVIFGEDEETEAENNSSNKASLAVKGLIIANRVEYNPHNNNYNQLGKKLIITLDGIVQEETSLTNIVLTVVGNGYYR